MPLNYTIASNSQQQHLWLTFFGLMPCLRTCSRTMKKCWRGMWSESSCRPNLILLSMTWWIYIIRYHSYTLSEVKLPCELSCPSVLQRFMFPCLMKRGCSTKNVCVFCPANWQYYASLLSWKTKSWEGSISSRF